MENYEFGTIDLMTIRFTKQGYCQPVLSNLLSGRSGRMDDRLVNQIDVATAESRFLYGGGGYMSRLIGKESKNPRS